MKKLLLYFGVLFLHFSIFSTEGSKTTVEKESQEVLKEESIVTTHSAKIHGKVLNYTATVGTIVLKDPKGTSKAKVFYIAYTKDQEGDTLRKRPITFCFNGGPGASSVWLHLGAFGPKRIVFDRNGYAKPPYLLADNEYSLLEYTDLVFIDPVSTGYSRPAPGEDVKQFHGVEEDIKSVAEFIRIYTTRHERWASPKFLAGESYGTTRAAGLAGHLHDKQHLYLDGIILVSSVLNFQTLSFSQPGNDLPYPLYLPSYTTTAWYHKKLPEKLQKDLPKTLKEVQSFALNEYSHALMLGDLIDPQERKKIIERISNYTGLSQDFIERSNLRVPLYRFVKELLRESHRTVGRFDSRIKGIDSDTCGETFEYDPSFDAIVGGFTAGFNSYVRESLHWKSDEEYYVLTDVRPWNYGSGGTNQYLNVGETLREVMTKNSDLGVFVASGYYDLATPFFATEYTFNHLGLDPSLKDHIEMHDYEGGHMMYTIEKSLEQLNKDISNFIEKWKPKS